MISWLEQLKQRSVTFLKTDKLVLQVDLSLRMRFKYRNFYEAALVSLIIDNLKFCGVSPSLVTVITPFQEQERLLNTHLSQYGCQVMTIDKA